MQATNDTQPARISRGCRTFQARHHADCPGCDCVCHPEALDLYTTDDLILQQGNLDTYARLNGFSELESFMRHVVVRRGQAQGGE